MSGADDDDVLDVSAVVGLAEEFQRVVPLEIGCTRCKKPIANTRVIVWEGLWAVAPTPHADINKHGACEGTFRAVRKGRVR